MRKNTEAALAAWQARRPARPAVSVWTDGETLFSYETAILTRDDDGRQIRNVTKYSPTTSQHQNAAGEWAGNTYDVDGLKRGATRRDLQAAAFLRATA